jgi:hypothetical protein
MFKAAMCQFLNPKLVDGYMSLYSAGEHHKFVSRHVTKPRRVLARRNCTNFAPRWFCWYEHLNPVAKHRMGGLVWNFLLPNGHSAVQHTSYWLGEHMSDIFKGWGEAFDRLATPATTTYIRQVVNQWLPVARKPSCQNDDYKRKTLSPTVLTERGWLCRFNVCRATHRPSSD